MTWRKDVTLSEDKEVRRFFQINNIKSSSTPHRVWGGWGRSIEILDSVLDSVGEVAADSCISPLPWFLNFSDKNDP